MGSLTEKLWLDVSLWSADLANLQQEIARLEPFADSFHLDACDGHYASCLLFFPDLVARLRELTRVPFHLHLMATRPMDLLDAFLEAGVDQVTVPIEIGKRVWQVLERVQSRGKSAGISFELDTPVELVRPFKTKVDTVVLMGTAMGVKGCGLDERACDRVTAMKSLIDETPIRLVADGGIRQETAPLLRASGADGLVPGSLICKSADLAAAAKWLKSL
ncbi:ribulose-phosphate 3-epimerase [Paludibaculum fermentans]|uniref:Ribulose-phosphate 3-epimerase n=1 Tax=Paludibaculum fermentans TaxID=1473598 RepID=A0A7S7NL98_PALFE|nr:ribulose-phosphate 3-epimerase [Paludibaculum fermentans]QOY85721.1 ribulose-phosphate 3-epimerase [Paludibaculum fermentans]